MSKVIISIVIPSYNSQDYIEETINSVINQTYQEWEMLIVDDCSNDGSYNIIKKYEKNDSRIKVFRLKKNSGCPALPRNYAIKKSIGQYIAFLDSDDIWHTQKLELQMNYMIKNNSVFTASEIKIFNLFDEIKTQMDKKLNENNIKTKKINHNKLIYKNIIPNSSVVIKKDIIDKFKFNIDLRYKAIEDYHMWLRLLQNGHTCDKLNMKLLFYRLAETSISKSKFSMFKKHYILYSEYKYRRKSLGFKKYLYLCSYAYFSIVNKLIRRRV